jgi:hypothetical protein
MTDHARKQTPSDGAFRPCLESVDHELPTKWAEKEKEMSQETKSPQQLQQLQVRKALWRELDAFEHLCAAIVTMARKQGLDMDTVEAALNREIRYALDAMDRD